MSCSVVVSVEDSSVAESEAGQLEGSPAEMKVEDFWELGPLQRAREKLGG